MVLPHPGRGPSHQELQVLVLADAADAEHEEETHADRDSFAERRDGALVFDALLNAEDIQLS